MDLGDFIRNKYPQFRTKQVNQKELDDYICRIQAGLEFDQAIDEIFLKHGGLDYRALRKEMDDKELAVGTDAHRIGEIFKLLNFLEGAIQKKPTIIDRIEDVTQIYNFLKELTEIEYKRINNKLKKPFKDMQKKLNFNTEEEYYYHIRKAYFRKGIKDVPEVVNELIPEVKFLEDINVTGGLHPSMIQILKNAEKELQYMSKKTEWDVKKLVRESIPLAGKNKKARAIGGFMPRTIGGGQNLSPHALGKAVDIDASSNPHLKGTPAGAIDKVLNWLHQNKKITFDARISSVFIPKNFTIEEEAKAEQLWIDMMLISEAFREFLHEYLDQYLDAKEKKKNPKKFTNDEVKKAEQFLNENKEVVTLLQNCIKAIGEQDLKKYRQNGLFDQPIQLIIAMVKGGATSGLEFSDESGKDEHHFQTKDWSKGLTPPPCVEYLTKKGNRRIK